MGEYYLFIPFLLVALIAVCGWICFAVCRKKLKKSECECAHLDKLLSIRANLARDVAHEIKNPITAILCSAETLELLLGEKLPEEHRKSLSYIREYSDQLLKLVTDFLDVSMAESALLKPEPSNVDVNNVLGSIVGLLQSNAQRKNITIKFIKHEANLTAYIDPKHLKQVIFNLLHNALKFTPERGEVQVSARSEFPVPFITIEVSDNGSGIAEGDLPHLFEPYYRSTDDSKVKQDGLGIGLAVCKNLVAAAGGEIKAWSREGVGTRFTVRIPAVCEDKKSIDEFYEDMLEILDDSTPLIQHKILVVADNNEVRDILVRLAEAWGGSVEIAETAQEVVVYASDMQFDIILIDSAVESGYGCELLRLIKSELKVQAKVITFVEDKEAEVRAISCGAAACLQKPISGNTLLKTILE